MARFVTIQEWATKEAEQILDAFFSNTGCDDCFVLHQAIVKALCHAYRAGKVACHKAPDTVDAS
jgi:hypothetical protein